MTHLATDYHDGIRYFDSKVESDVEIPLVLVHGLGTSLRFWSAVAPKLAEARRIVAFDVPGYGRSRLPRDEFSLQAVARDGLALLSSLGVERSIIAGHSIGAVVALEMARQRPDIVARVVLVSGTLFKASRVLRNPISGASRPLAALSVFAQFVGGMLPMNDVTLWLLSNSPLLRCLTLWPFAASPARLDGDLLREALLDDSGKNMLLTLKALYNVDLVQIMAEIKQPVALIWGREDRLLTPSDIDESLELLNVVSKVVIENSGHWPMVEQPKALTAAIEAGVSTVV